MGLGYARLLRMVSIAAGKHTLLGHRYICMYVHANISALIQVKSVCKEGIKFQY